MDIPWHIMVAPPLVVIVGELLTVMFLVVVLLHPAALVPITVYVVATVGEQVTGDPIDDDRLDAGDQI